MPLKATSIGANALSIFGARTFAMIFSVLTGIIVAKALGPDGKGVYSGVQVMVAIVTALTGGAGAAITYLLTKKQKAIAQLLPALALVLTGVTLLAWAAVSVIFLLRGVSIVTLSFAVVLPAAVLLSWQPSYYVATGHMRSLNVQTIALAAGILLSVVASVYILHLGTTGVIVGWVLCTYLAAAFLTWRLFVDGKNQRSGSLREVLHVILTFGGQSGVNVLLGVLNYRIDSLLIVSLLGFRTFGIYSVAVAVGELLFMLSRPVAMAISKDVGISELRSSAAMTARAVRITTAIVAVAGAISFIVGPWLIKLVYGARFSGAALPLQILLPGIVAFSTVGIFVTFFLLQLARPALVTYYNLIMLAVQSVACVLLLPRFGMAGAAFGSSLTYLVGAAFNSWLFGKATGIGPRQLWVLERADIARLVQLLRRRPGKPTDCESLTEIVAPTKIPSKTFS